MHAGEEAVVLARTAPDDTELRVPVAYATQIISVCLGEQGRPEEAEARSREAVPLWRSVISAGAEKHLQQLSQCLLNRGNLLWTQGHRSGGLAVTAEAVEVVRRLAADRPARYLPDLALCLRLYHRCRS